MSQSLGAGIDSTGGWRDEEAGGIKEQIWRAVESHAHLCSGTCPIVFQVFTSQVLKSDCKLLKDLLLYPQHPV